MTQNDFQKSSQGLHKNAWKGARLTSFTLGTPRLNWGPRQGPGKHKVFQTMNRQPTVPPLSPKTYAQSCAKSFPRARFFARLFTEAGGQFWSLFWALFLGPGFLLFLKGDQNWSPICGPSFGPHFCNIERAISKKSDSHS